MKYSLALLSLLTVGSSAFQPTISRSAQKQTTTALSGWFFDKPVHGHGSGEGQADMDEQWETQQAILAERRGHIDKAHLKQKYKSGNVKFNVKAMEQKESQMDDTYVEGEGQQAKKKVGGFKMPWDK